MNTKQIKINETKPLEPMPFVAPVQRPQPQKVPPPPSPSRFHRAEFKESDYESDFDTKIRQVWTPSDSDSNNAAYKSVRRPVTPTSGRTSQNTGGNAAVPPTEFERPLQFEGPPRPKFEPIHKFKPTIKLDQATFPVQPQPMHKPTPVTARPQPPPPQQPFTTKFYTAIAGAPQHIASETSNSMQIRESSENAHRVVNMNQTKRVIQFDSRKSHFEERSEVYEPQSPSPRQRLPPPATPTKFIPTETRESDYESEIESARIRSLWTPNPSDTDEPQYRRVSAPSMRCSSVPKNSGGGRVLTPMDFDNRPIEMPSKITIDTNHKQNGGGFQTQTLNRYASKKNSSSYTSTHQTQSSSTTRDDIGLKPCSPPKYGYMPGDIVNEAHQKMQQLNYSMKSKTGQFMQDIASDSARRSVEPPARTILKKEDGNKSSPQAYREESRVSQYGKF